MQAVESTQSLRRKVCQAARLPDPIGGANHLPPWSIDQGAYLGHQGP